MVGSDTPALLSLLAVVLVLVVFDFDLTNSLRLLGLGLLVIDNASCVGSFYTSSSKVTTFDVSMSIIAVPEPRIDFPV